MVCLRRLQSIKAELDSARAAIEKAEADRERLLQVRELANSNLEILARLKQGCDEMESDAVVTDYSDAGLVPRTMVDSANADIIKQGKEKVGILTKIKDFRKSINVMKWEHEYLRMQVRTSVSRPVSSPRCELCSAEAKHSCVCQLCGLPVVLSFCCLWLVSVVGRQLTRKSTTRTYTCCA
jgi:hypothetical protein